MSQVKHPEVTVKLSGEDGNAMSIIGRTRRAMRRGGVPDAELEAFTKEAMSGDYDHVLQTVMNWVETE